MDANIIWLIIFVLTLILEGLTTALISIWFSIGALFAFITTYFTNNISVQIIVFISVCIFSIIVAKPLFKKSLSKVSSKTNCDDLIGKVGIVLETVTEKKMGVIKVKNQTWSALNSDKGSIDKDEEVEVLYIEGVKLIVRKKEC